MISSSANYNAVSIHSNFSSSPPGGSLEKLIQVFLNMDKYVVHEGKLSNGAAFAMKETLGVKNFLELDKLLENISRDPVALGKMQELLAEPKNLEFFKKICNEYQLDFQRALLHIDPKLAYLNQSGVVAVNVNKSAKANIPSIIPNGSIIEPTSINLQKLWDAISIVMHKQATRRSFNAVDYFKVTSSEELVALNQLKKTPAFERATTEQLQALNTIILQNGAALNPRPIK